MAVDVDLIYTYTVSSRVKTPSLTGYLDLVCELSLALVSCNYNNPHVWLDLNSPIRLFSRHRAALEPKSLGEFMKVD